MVFVNNKVTVKVPPEHPHHAERLDSLKAVQELCTLYAQGEMEKAMDVLERAGLQLFLPRGETDVDKVQYSIVEKMLHDILKRPSKLFKDRKDEKQTKELAKTMLDNCPCFQEVTLGSKPLLYRVPRKFQPSRFVPSKLKNKPYHDNNIKIKFEELDEEWFELRKKKRSPNWLCNLFDKEEDQETHAKRLKSLKLNERLKYYNQWSNAAMINKISKLPTHVPAKYFMQHDIVTWELKDEDNIVKRNGCIGGCFNGDLETF